MKVAIIILGLSALAAATHDFDNDIEVFLPDIGLRSQSIYPAPGLDVVNIAPEGVHYRRRRDTGESRLAYLQGVSSDPEFYRTSEELNYKRSRRAPSDAADYDKTYQDFVRAHFGSDHGDKKTSESGRSGKYESAHSGSDGHSDAHSYGSYEPSDDYEHVKYLSQKQSEEIKKNPDNCKEKIEGNMKCMVCHNPKTGDKSQSCSYSSTPDDKKYAFVKQKHYNSKDDESSDEDKEGEESKQKEQIVATTKAPRRKSSRKPTHSRKARPNVAPEKYTVVEHQPSNREPRDAIGLDPFLYGTKKSGKKTNEEKEKSFEDYYSHVFPEEKKNGKLQQKLDFEFVPDYETKTNVDKVLAEFKKRDWSKCKKTIKGDLTCYACKSGGKTTHEECMYISETEPKHHSSGGSHQESSHTDKRDAKEEEGDSADDAVTTSKPAARSRKAKKVLIKKKVINKRKDDVVEAPQPEDHDTDQHVEKQTVKRTVSVSYQSNENGGNDPPKTMFYEHEVSHLADF